MGVTFTTQTCVLLFKLKASEKVFSIKHSLVHTLHDHSSSVFCILKYSASSAVAKFLLHCFSVSGNSLA